VPTAFPTAAFPVQLGQIPHLYLVVAAIVVIVVVAMRFRPVRILFNFLLTAALLTTLAVLLLQRGQFDPYLSKIASRLHLSNQQVVGSDVRIGMSPDGHFWVHAMIDGVPQRMLVDSGATITALSSTTAQQAGLNVGDTLVPVVLQTANGAIAAQTATVGTLKLGDIVARDLPVVVSPAFGNTNVIGMNFLSKLKSWRVEDGTLILQPHHPQAAETS
jgi:aspartyl protease family protein